MPSSSGLAEQVTTSPRVFHPVRGVRSQTEIRGGISISQALGDLNRQRRLRRMRRVVIASADAAKDHIGACGGNYWNPFVLLTYRPGVAWAPEHISDYLKAVRRSASVQFSVPVGHRVAAVRRAALSRAVLASLRNDASDAR